MLKELRQLWDSLPNKLEFGLLLAAWIAVFHFLGNSVLGYVDTASLFVWLDTLHANAARTDSDDAFGRYVPYLVLMLLFVRRFELIEAPKRPWAPALLLLVAAVLLHVVGFLIQQTRVSIVAFLTGGFALMGLLWGVGWLRAVFFPYFLLGFTIPVSSYLDGITYPLRLVSTSASTWICTTLFRMKLERSGTLVLFPGAPGRAPFQFDVAAACSGIRSATIVLLLTVAFAWLNYRTPWRRAVIVAASVPLALFANMVRLIGTFVVSEIWSQKAGAWVETKAGMITFLVALAGVFALGRFLREPVPPASTPGNLPEPSPASHPA
jgi:exosortase